MVVCSYYLRGTCKYGDRCRNEHPGATATFGNQTWTSNNNRVVVPYTVESMMADVTPNKDKPLWPLSSYGPSKYEPLVISGLDESPEELRLRAVMALGSGKTDEYTKYEGEKTVASDQVYMNARSNVKQLYEQALKASAHVSPVSGATTSAFATPAPSAFGTNATPSGFGGSTNQAFGKPAFGQPTFGQAGFAGSVTGTSVFGQGAQGTSVFGAAAQPASGLNQPNQATSAFGQPPSSTFAQQTPPTSVFGQSSAFGATSQPTSTFGQSTQPASVFVQSSQSASAFGQPPQPTSAFGQSSQPTSVFGQPSQSTSAFGQATSAFSPASTFGQSSQPAFGQSSLIKPASGAFSGTGGGGFSAFSAQPSSFSAAAASTGPAMGATPVQSAFGTAPQVQSVFGAALSAPKPVGGDGQPTPIGTSLFGNTLSVPAVQSPPSAMGGSPFSFSPMSITPSSERPVAGKPDFAGAKAVARMRPGADHYLALLPADYNEIIPADVKAAFAGAKFEWGKIPEWIPPESVR